MKLTGGEIIAEFLIKEKVPYIIGIPGHGCLGLADAFIGREDRIGILQVKQEMAAVHMADGYYRITGKPLAVFTSIGPGAMNTAIGVATAYVDSTAVLVITGGTHTHMRGKGVLQEIERSHDANFPSVLEPIVKRHWKVERVEQLPSILPRAFNYMLTGRPGPVFIDLPMDVQCDAVEVNVSAFEKRKPVGRVCGDAREITKAAELLLQAKRPVFLLGGGVITSGAWKEVKELAEYIGAAVITTMMGKGAFPEDHQLYAWHAGSKGTTCGNYLASTADVLLAVGCRFADETTSSYKQGTSFSIPPTKVIHIDIDPTEIGKNYPVEVGIVGDAKAVLAAIVELVKSLQQKSDYRSNSYFKEIQQLKKEWFAHLDKLRTSDLEPVTISRALKEIREFLSREAIVVTSSGNTQAQVLQEFPFYKPRTCITTGGFSTMGFTLPASLGVKLAAPDKQVVGILGDGDFMMTMQELATAVQLNLPIVLLIFNNMGWISIKDLQMGAYGEERAFATDFVDKDGRVYSPDFKGIAANFGCYAERVEKAEEIKSALQRAFASGKPAVIEIIVNREYPYSGSPAVGWWDVPVPEYLAERRKQYELAREGEFLA
ncbi:thiamine pyrophosphate-binding protein [candidate division KSB1 bacterium]|nr:MAG: thiamine pyrophosphate-binding protein [candidate division KSB1 bacterium]RKY84386.1 MAG: thiamine pyrophosphate-binding protein [candidate division KSB1 bacterium]RKY89828.1 MAG: thiamine pyrophosphate-binding protein [candidate division KSB1 bacterium]